MLVAKGGVVAGVTINTGAVVSNAGIVKANSALSAVIGGVVTNANTIEALGSGAVVEVLGSITDTGTVLASGNGAHVELDGAVISGGKLQTLAGGEIDVNFGVLSDATIASGSIVDINNNGTLALSGRIANSGLISALGSSVATLAISGAVVLSGGGKVSLSPSGDNQIIAAAGGGILSNVNNTIAGAGHIARRSDSGQQRHHQRQHGVGAAADLCDHDQCRQARGNGERRRALTRRQHQQYRHWHYFSLGQRRARCP